MHSKNKVLNLTAIISAAVVVAVAIMGLFAWIPGLSFLGSVSTQFIPMAPLTSICFILLGLIVLSRTFYRLRGWQKFSAVAVTTAVSVLGMMEFAECFSGLDIEDFFIPDAGMLGLVRKARMSPATGATFFLAGVAMLFVLLRETARERLKALFNLSGIVGILVVIIGIAFLFSYLYGDPLLYGSQTIPMAAMTAVGFVLLGIGITAVAGEDTIPLRLVMGKSTRSRLLRTFLPLSIFIVLCQDLLHDFALISFLNSGILSALSLVGSVVVTGIIVTIVGGAIGRGLDTAEAKRRQAEENLYEYQKRLQSLASELSRAEEETRRRIAVELHDNVGHALTITKMKAETLYEQLVDTAHADGANEIVDSMVDSIKNVSSFVFELSPSILYESGLEAGIEWFAEQFETQFGVTCSFEGDGRGNSLPDEVQILLFRSIRELLMNIRKHAQARTASVIAGGDGTDYTITVIDDGIGFDPSDIAMLRSGGGGGGGFGLFSITERINYHDGSIEIESEPGKGTKVKLKVPLLSEVCQ